MRVLSKLGLMIIAASLSALCGNSLTVFRGSVGSPSPRVEVLPETYGGICQLLVSYNYSITINSDEPVEFMVIPFNQLFEQYGKHSDYAIASMVIENWGKLTFKPYRRGIYALALRTADSEAAMASFSILAIRVFELDFLYDSLIIAASGGLLSLAGLLIEKGLKRRQTS